MTTKRGGKEEEEEGGHRGEIGNRGFEMKEEVALRYDFGAPRVDIY